MNIQIPIDFRGQCDFRGLTLSREMPEIDLTRANQRGFIFASHFRQFCSFFTSGFDSVLNI